MKSFAATVRSYLLNRWILAVAAATLVVTITVILWPGDTAPAEGQGVTISGGGNTVSQNEVSDSTCGQVGNNSTCVVEAERRAGELAKEAPTDEQFKALLSQDAIAPPTGPGPWPFMVVDTGPKGLFARDGSGTVADRVGVAANRSVIWADCVVTDGLQPPDSENNVGPVWVRVRWKSSEPTQAFLTSDPGDTERAWMYRGYLAPFRHNGEIPTCPR